jgi:hypothetical protein
MSPRRSTPARVAALAVVAACVPACTLGADQGTTPLPRPSRAAFRAEAGPILAERCGDFSCHGVADRPYSIFAVGRLRLDPADRYRPTPLSGVELDADYDATLGFLDAPRGRDTTLVRKALGIGGPGGHRGGAVFEAPSDPECRAVIAWIEGPQ